LLRLSRGAAGCVGEVDWVDHAIVLGLSLLQIIASANV
jgi:hypothetical protein